MTLTNRIPRCIAFRHQERAGNSALAAPPREWMAFADAGCSTMATAT